MCIDSQILLLIHLICVRGTTVLFILSVAIIHTNQRGLQTFSWQFCVAIIIHSYFPDTPSFAGITAYIDQDLSGMRSVNIDSKLRKQFSELRVANASLLSAASY